VTAVCSLTALILLEFLLSTHALLIGSEPSRVCPNEHPIKHPELSSERHVGLTFLACITHWLGMDVGHVPKYTHNLMK